MKKKTREAISVLYRVQGGCGDKKSKKYITVENNEINTEKLKPDATLYIGDSQHMVYFLKKRLGVKGRITDYITTHMDLQELSEQDVEVVKMYVPEWFKYALSATAVGQKNTRFGLPKLVDKSTPGDSFGISGWWVKLLKDSCYYAENIQVHNFYDVLGLITDDDIKNALKKFRNLPEETLLNDIKRIHRINPFNENVLTKLEMRNPIFSRDIFLEEGRDL